MDPIVIVTGCPGAGKTSLSRSLAAEAVRGLHLETDRFYAFPARLVDPTKPESQAQNATMIRAIARATGAFAEGGYEVFVDGIVGPWFLPTFLAELPEEARVDYVVLETSLAVAQERVRRREGAGESARVAHMHRAFAQLGDYAGHALAAEEAPAEELLRRFRERRQAGGFRLERGR